MKIQLFSYFFLPVLRTQHSMSACCHQHSRKFSYFALQCMHCRLPFSSRSCACAPFSSASGGTPTSRTLPHWELQTLQVGSYDMNLSWNHFNCELLVHSRHSADKKVIARHWSCLFKMECMDPSAWFEIPYRTAWHVMAWQHEIS